MKLPGEEDTLWVPDLSSMEEPLILDAPAASLVSNPHCLLDMDLLQTPSGFDSFSCEFTLEVTEEAVIRGILGWFEVEMSPGQWFNTSPLHGATHWHQTFFPLLERFGGSPGSKIKGTFALQPHEENHRGLRIQIDLIEPALNVGSKLIFNWE
jgi:hypothetical protein